MKKTFLGIFQTYASSNLYHLPGVAKDAENLRALTNKYYNSADGWTCELLVDSSYEDIVGAIEDLRPTILWFCGHGILSTDGRNIYMIGDMSVNLDDRTMYNLLEADIESMWSVYIFDFCHSCTMVNLKYYYVDGTFYSKVLDQDPSLFDDHPLVTKICIAGASDFETTSEDYQGGRLTNYLAWLLRTYGFVSLRVYEQHLPKNLRSVISVNKPIDIDDRILG